MSGPEDERLTEGRSLEDESSLTEHDVIRCVTSETLQVSVRRVNFDVTTATVDLLFVFDGELNDQRFALVGEFIEVGRKGVETRVFGCLQA